MKSNYYNEKYFKWQSQVGSFGGLANKFKFEKYIKKSDCLIDYGCGGGFLLKEINCINKVGVEINRSAREFAKKNGEIVYKNLDSIKDNWADIIISNHVLEHVSDPLGELKKLYKKLKKGGKIIFVVPFEISNSYKDDDINQHLYTWSPQNLANLFKRAGYSIAKVDVIHHCWPPFYYQIYKIFGLKVFNIISIVYAYLVRKMYQTKIIAIKK